MLQQRPSREKGLNEALLSEAAGLNSDTMLLRNFEEQQQLKTQLHYINYAFTLCLGGFSEGLNVEIQRL